MRQITAAVGILQRGDGGVFIQRRQRDNPHYPGYWEFPGGKVEEGETPAQALARELREEVGIEADAARLRAWLVRRHQYEHALVTLHFFRVGQWQGQPLNREGQQWEWRQSGEKPPQLLPANECLWKWLALPPRCVVSAAEVIGVEETLARLPQVAAAPVLLQLRDKNLPAAQRRLLAEKMARQVQGSGGLLVVNDDEQLAREVGADGVHLSARRLMAAAARPPFEWAGASCHSAAELAQAQALELDYAVLSPVCKTLTHVDAPPLGWEGFAAHAQGSAIPLYALGGLAPGDLSTALSRGAHGIAMMRQGWQADGC